jgi:hypothetical protein
MNSFSLVFLGFSSALIANGCLGLSDSPTKISLPRFSSEIINQCEESIFAGTQTSDNSIVLTGEFAINNYSKLIFKKITNTGKLVWEHKFDSMVYEHSDYRLGSEVIQTRDAGYLIRGPSSESFFLKTDSLGEYKWQISLSLYQPSFYPSSGRDKFIKAIANGPEKDILALGFHGGDVRQIHLDPSGKVVKIDSAYFPGFEAGMVKYSSDGIWIVGITDSAVTGSDTLHYFSVLKFDFTLHLLLRSDISIQSEFPESYRNIFEMGFHSFAPSPNGNIVAYGYGIEKKVGAYDFSREYLQPIIIVLDENLRMASAKIVPYEGDKSVYGGYRTTTGEYFILGVKKNGPYGGDDVYIEKYGAKGILLWTKYFGGPGLDLFVNAFPMPHNRIMIIGSSEFLGSSCNFYPLSSFIFQIDENGNAVGNR